MFIDSHCVLSLSLIIDCRCTFEYMYMHCMHDIMFCQTVLRFLLLESPLAIHTVCATTLVTLSCALCTSKTCLLFITYICILSRVQYLVGLMQCFLFVYKILLICDSLFVDITVYINIAL